MSILNKSLQAYFLIISVIGVTFGVWREQYWLVYPIFLGLICCLIFGDKEIRDGEFSRLSELDFVSRLLETLFLACSIGLAFRSGDGLIQVFCFFNFILYYIVYLRIFPKSVRKKTSSSK